MGHRALRLGDIYNVGGQSVLRRAAGRFASLDLLFAVSTRQKLLISRLETMRD